MEQNSVSRVEIVSRRQEDKEEPGSWMQVLSSCGNRATPTQKNREDGGNKGPAMEKHLGSGNNKAYSVRSSPRYSTFSTSTVNTQKKFYFSTFLTCIF
jgi:hypothetical protein